MLPRLNNTRNNQASERNGGSLGPLSVSQLCGHERLGIGSHVREDWDFGWVDTHHILGCWKAPSLWLVLDTHSLPTPQRIMHHGSLSTNTMNVMTCSLKNINPLTSYPSQQKWNHLPSYRNSLSNSFQPLALFPFSSRFRSSTLLTMWKDTR